MGKLGQAWDSEIEPVFSGPHGILTIRELRAKSNSFSNLNKGEDYDTQYTRHGCKKCQCVIDFDEDGHAYCPICKSVFNGPNSPEIIDIIIRGSGEKIIRERTPPPVERKRLPNSFWKAAKNGRPG
ncbi:MAG: hypothetical protein WC455_12760 [Dehalococcoidia bacterium]